MHLLALDPRLANGSVGTQLDGKRLDLDPLGVGAFISKTSALRKKDGTTTNPPATFIYLFHSFGDPVFSSMLDRINESLERRPRRLVLIYARPLLHSRLLATGRFRLVKVSRGLRPDLESHRIHVYVGG